MNRRNVIGLTAITSIALSVAGWSLWAAEQAGATKARPAAVKADAGDKASGDKPADLEETLRRLDVQTAELSLQLYELDLQKIDDLNAKMPGLYSNAEGDRFRTSVEMARQRVKAARERAEGKDSVAIIGVGQALLQNAIDNYDRDQAANRRLPTAVKQIDVDRDRVAVAMAKVNLEKAKVVTQLDSPTAMVNWEIDVLRDEVRQLRWRITAITSRR
jgi:hypothetical protein